MVSNSELISARLSLNNAFQRCSLKEQLLSELLRNFTDVLGILPHIEDEIQVAHAQMTIESDKSSKRLRLTMTDQRAVFLSQDDIPTSWYNIQADLPEKLPPPLNPATLEPMSPEPLFRLFAKELVAQEVSQERWIKIPGGSPGSLQVASETDAIDARIQVRAVPKDASKNILQVGGRESSRQPQAKHSNPAGVLQQKAGNAETT